MTHHVRAVVETLVQQGAVYEPVNAGDAAFGCVTERVVATIYCPYHLFQQLHQHWLHVFWLCGICLMIEHGIGSNSSRQGFRPAIC